MDIAVDFDGVVAKDGAWPEIGEPDARMILALIGTQKNGHVLILDTCRTGKYLDEAVRFSMAHGLTFDYIGENNPERIAKYGGDCRKISAGLYVEDKDACWNRELAIERLNNLPVVSNSSKQAHDFAVGERVRLLVNDPIESTDLVTGSLGIIVDCEQFDEITKLPEFLVNWDNWGEGHNGGRWETNSHWWVSRAQIALAEKAPD